jgi:tetratricopeptide (TPR) repeat protein
MPSILGALHRGGRGAEIDALAAETRRRIGDSHNAIEQATLNGTLNEIRATRGDVAGALEHGRLALDWAMRTQNQFIRGVSLTAWGRGLLLAGRVDEAIVQLEQAIVLLVDRAIGHGYAVGFSLPLLAEAWLRRGDLAAARAAAERGIELAAAMGYRHAQATNQIALARVLVAGGDTSGAEALLARATDLAAAMDARDLPPLIEEARAELARRLGDDPACEHALRTAARLHRQNGEEGLATQAEARIGEAK